MTVKDYYLKRTVNFVKNFSEKEACGIIKQILLTDILQMIANLSEEKIVTNVFHKRRLLSKKVYIAQWFKNAYPEGVFPTIGFSLGGQCVLGFEDKNYIANVGDVFIHTAVTRQIETYFKRKKAYKILWFNLQKEFCGIQVTFYNPTKGFIVPFIITIPNDERLIFLTQNIISWDKNKDILVLKQLLTELVVLLIQKADKFYSGEYTPWQTKLLDGIKVYIKDKYRQNISVKDLADKVFLSPNYFSWLFKKGEGISVKRFINVVRINNAKKLLLNPKFRIKQIASRTGYRNEYYFSKVFKKIEGIYPGQYRNIK